jgi:hypothetical protein
MGRVAGRDENDLGELQAFMNVRSNGQMAIMDRIEASAEQAQLQQRARSGKW